MSVALKIRTTVASLGILLALAGCASRGATREDKDPYLQAIQGDLREAARRFAAGRLTARQYLALVADRTGKVRLFQVDPAWKAAVAGGDRDGDRVSDRVDACPDTPMLTGTDRRGCPVPPPDCPPQDPACVPPGDRKAQELLDGVTFLFDPACDGSPIPQTPQPLEWGRGSTSFNLAVTRVDNQKPGCTLFYEMQFRIEQPGLPALHLNVLFKASEDLSPGNPRRAVFPIPTSTPLPPQRAALRFALHLAMPVQWRVRAVNGAEGVSTWSGLRKQGPASSGVNP
ncbi:MAG: hypothetical protein ACJ76Y_15490 [Thermoanaerobaculia bacterium]